MPKERSTTSRWDSAGAAGRSSPARAQVGAGEAAVEKTACKRRRSSIGTPSGGASLSPRVVLR
eukprot:7961413-Pyramimonas_sp.AAC.1